MNRRDILKTAAWLSGAAIATPLATAVLTGCTESPPETKPPTAPNGLAGHHFFSPDSFARVTLVADTLLPATDSPAASAVGVPETLDSMLGLVLNTDYVNSFRRVWADLEAFLERQGFAGLNAEEREALLSELETADEASVASAREALVMLKQQVVIFYLTSETIAEEHLNYLPIPGQYQPCISVDDVNNTAWAI
ncbi:gluconate 2-dehydrogenase subunit 3 family protein [Marinimicrobium agarilyticum]|uniref:gluconate 2-dehydrogenase subunit 3 family protein n=1 Tax=Marinimicrobium agarilyticum TaxID=306546 RepID=UPI00042A8749|nr:gluconate 2-dehydrogenase subunit 3 family protein [Marinimicrobium agarilyticum]